jgi:rod shape-determining protein MreD
MKYLIYSFIIVLLVGLVGGVFDVFTIFRSVPQLMLLFVAIIAAERKNFDFAFIAITGGILMDAMTSVAVGSYILSYLAIGLVIKYVFENYLLSSNSWKHLPWIVAASILFQHIWLWLYNGTLARVATGVPAFTFSEIIILSIGGILYTLLLYLPGYWLIERLNDYLVSMEQRKKY